mmetsp:Transcript_819/g.1193  ORF Transcript_819/g.1193 Transcript_819/m.1193 type:complete len:129 (+) Transcript_819:89-475(+)
MAKLLLIAQAISLLSVSHAADEKRPSEAHSTEVSNPSASWMEKGYNDFPEYTQTYAGKYEQFMSQGDQGDKPDSKGMQEGNMPQFSQEFMPKSFGNYVEAPTDSSGSPSYMQAYGQNGASNAGGGQAD